MATEQFLQCLQNAVAARAQLFDARHTNALRLFNGFTEGCAEIVVDLYAQTIVIHNYADPAEQGIIFVQAAQEFLCAQLPWLQAIIVKTRHGKTSAEKCGSLIYGANPAHKICEHGVWYAVDLLLNRDASFYLDTRNVRQWAQENLRDKVVLNTFAYTGSLGVAALAGGAARVVQLDLNRNFLNLAKTSYTLNGFAIHQQDFLAGDFFSHVSRLKKNGALFDCVFLDPPIFSTTKKGVVDLANSYSRLINKVRPLINDGGYLLAINNALFYSGADFLREIEALCADGYLTMVEMISVPQDFIGNAEAQNLSSVADPAPFNHATKILVLKVKRK